jgi:hypothetical protein
MVRSVDVCVVLVMFMIIILLPSSGLAVFWSCHLRVILSSSLAILWPRHLLIHTLSPLKVRNHAYKDEVSTTNQSHHDSNTSSQKL